MRGSAVNRCRGALCVAFGAVLVLRAAADPVRLAVVCDNDELSRAADLLTVTLSQGDDLSVLEREQVSRVWKEQALSTAVARDSLKLGEILGADGVLVLERIEQRSGLGLLSARLMAVKPGVVLDLAEYELPLQDVSEWSKLASGRIVALFPKLTVPAQDAVPISLLNLRAAVKSAETEALERELSLLLLRRLIHEKEIFVLERRNLKELANEKEYKGPGDAPFWDGGWLLEGTIDKDGYDRETATVSVRLTPRGKPPVELEVRGKRAEAPALIADLSAKILSVIRKPGAAKEWDALAEANRYYEEAKWALRWGLLREAQGAAESAWALGKKDLDAATVRVQANVALAIPDYEDSRRGITRDPVLGNWVRRLSETAKIEFARRALEAYVEFSRTLSSEEPRLDSPWYMQGIQALESASRVLAVFQLVPEAIPSASERLADLRASARAAAQWLSRSPSVRTQYFPGGNDLTDETVLRAVLQKTNIVQCQIDYGCLWADTPESAAADYRRLTMCAAFDGLCPRLAFRGTPGTNRFVFDGRRYIPARAQLAPPRLVAWNSEDEVRIPGVWGAFVQELAASTNLVRRIEAELFKVADAPDTNEREVEPRLKALLNWDPSSAVANYSQLRSFQVGVGEVCYHPPWRTLGPELQQAFCQFNSALGPLLEPVRAEARFAEQKAYLTLSPPWNHKEFWRIFAGLQYARVQASELLPLVVAYKSNLVAQVGVGPEYPPGRTPFWELDLLEDRLNSVVNSTERPVPFPTPLDLTNISRGMEFGSRQGSSVRQPSPVEPLHPEQAPGTNSLFVSRYFELPQDHFNKTQGPPDPKGTSAVGRPPNIRLWLLGHRVREGRLWLELYCAAGGSYLVAAAVLDPACGRWEIIDYPRPSEPPGPLGLAGVEAPDRTPHFEVFNGALFVSQWQDRIRKYDLRTRRWKSLDVPTERPARLFALNKHLYAANDIWIVELENGGAKTRLLASCRRRPVAPALDSRATLGEVTLFSGPEASLCASVGEDIFRWNGQDWTETLTFPHSGPVEVVAGGVLFRSNYMVLRTHPNVPRVAFLAQAITNSDLWFLPQSQTRPELCIHEQAELPRAPRAPGVTSSSQPTTPPPWPALPDGSLARAPVTMDNSSFYFLVVRYNVANHASSIPTPGGSQFAKLVRLDRDFSQPLVVPIGFDPRLCPLSAAGVDWNLASLTSSPASWIVFVQDFLLIGNRNLTRVWAIPRSELDLAFAAEKSRLATAQRDAAPKRSPPSG